MNLPKHLRALTDHLANTEDRFGDWQLARKGSLTPFYPPEEELLVAEAEKNFLPFAGSFSGGVLVLDLANDDIEQAAVIEFDSEGGITVLGTSFSDFLSTLASEDGNPEEDGRTVEPAMRAWILSQGLMPHPSFAGRLAELGESTRQANIRWNELLRHASRRLRPDEIIDYSIMLGESFGGVALDDIRARKSPFLLKPRSGEPEAVILYAGRHEARTTDGVNFMFMPASEAMSWLISHRYEPIQDRGHILAPKAKLRLRVSPAGAGRNAAPWVQSIEMTK